MRRNLSIVALVVVMAFLVVGTAVAETVTLNVWISDKTYATQQFIDNELVPQFEADHPNIKVNVEYVNWGVFYDKLYASFAGGTSPDIFQGGSSFRGSAATKNLGLIIDKYTKDWADKDDFFPGSWAAVSWEGHDYGIPSLTAPRSIIYRADLMSEVGINPDNPPTTWDDVRKASAKLTKVASDGVVNRWGFKVPKGSWGFWLPLLWQAGGDLVSPDGNQPLFNTPEGVEAARFYRDWYKEQSQVGSLPSGGFSSGAYAMDYTNTKAVTSIVSKDPLLADDFRVGPPMKNAKQATAVYTDSLFVSNQTKHPDEVWEFLKWFAKTENITRYNETVLYMPPRRSAMASDYVRTNSAIRQNIELVMPYGVVNPAYSGGANKALVDAFKKLFNDEWTPQEALDNAANLWEPLTN